MSKIKIEESAGGFSYEAGSGYCKVTGWHRDRSQAEKILSQYFGRMNAGGGGLSGEHAELARKSRIKNRAHA
jgi:hypothetical protein